jgi:protein-disulfide isomerase
MKCLNNNTFQQRINVDQKEAQTLGFTGTPGLVFINNTNNKTIVKQGALNLKNLTLFSHMIADK